MSRHEYSLSQVRKIKERPPWCMDLSTLLGVGIDLSTHTSQWSRHFVKHRRTTCSACIPTSFWIQARSPRCALNSGCLVSPFSRWSWNHSRCSQPVVNPTPCCRPVVVVAQEGIWLTSNSFATLNANLERPPAIWRPALLMHSCISLLA